MNAENKWATLEVLQRHTGACNAMRLQNITHDVYGASSSILCRRTRENIAALRLEGWPIVSESGKAGYYMAETREELAIIRAEIMSRIINLQKVYNSIGRRMGAAQMELFEEINE